MTSPYRWIWEFALQARSNGDEDRLRLVEILEVSQSYPTENPDARLALYRQGLDLARNLNEPWWVVVFEYWISETLLYYKHDPEGALKVCARMVVETRKPIYAAQPERVGLSLNFIAAYTRIDPIGYEKQIRGAIESGEKDWQLYEGFYEVHWQLKTRFLTAISDPEAVDVAWDHLRAGFNHQALHDSTGHYVIYALIDLLAAMWLLDEEQARHHTADLAHFGEEMSPLSENDRLEAVFTMWRAVGARIAGDEEAAQAFYRSAFAKQAALAEPRNAVYWPAIYFHRERGETDRLLEVCEEAARISEEFNLRFEAATLRLKQCEVASAAGLNPEIYAHKLREVSAKLPSKTYWEEKLKSLPSAA
ncbi:hypothetical protein EON80_03895 [bacterium]|nr:MAG: hypothetical protein EON80_03895 [bacterium]